MCWVVEIIDSREMTQEEQVGKNTKRAKSRIQTTLQSLHGDRKSYLHRSQATPNLSIKDGISHVFPLTIVPPVCAKYEMNLTWFYISNSHSLSSASL